MIRLHNTLGNKIEELKDTVKPGVVKMYHCGPTVYGPQHIGNLSMFIFTDILRRTIESEGFKVEQVINFTDFGHLTSDSDEGEDKMTKGLKQAGLAPTLENMKTLGKKYAKLFRTDLKKLNIKTRKTFFPFASDYIEAQKKLIKTLENKGFTYKTSNGIYYDISKFPSYGILGGQGGKKDETRIGLNKEKRNQRDFALWKFNPQIGFESEWGLGFPGWHIECSAMIIELLGPQIDIHTGGIEHIVIHHNNEIAQSEAATGLSPFSKFWLHRQHLKIDNAKIAKSFGNVVYLSEITDMNISPIAFRYLVLSSHYRTPTNFTQEALESAGISLNKIHEKTIAFLFQCMQQSLTGVRSGRINKEYKKLFDDAIKNDLNTPEALAVLWKLLRVDGGQKINFADSFATIKYFDKVLGLGLSNIKIPPQDILNLMNERVKERNIGNFAKSDELRKQIENKGYTLKDTENGPVLSPK